MVTKDLDYQIKKPKSNIFRRAYLKRRTQTDALFENDWQEITQDVIKWGKIRQKIDVERLNKFKLSNMTLTLQNREGKYSSDDIDSSIWNGYLGQQRTLFKIEAGFYETTERTPGFWQKNEYPEGSLWDSAYWDEDESVWDAESDPTVFVGILYGDIPVSDKQKISLNLAPLTQVFRDYSAYNLRGYDTSMTASKFMDIVWNHTDGSGGFIFRPFFQDTTTYWDVQTTTTIYSDLNTYTSEDVRKSSVWNVMEKLAESENYVAYVTQNGTFRFVDRNEATSATSFHFGAGFRSGKYGNTIKTLDAYGKKYSKYYSRVQTKFVDENTSTSYFIKEASLTVNTASNPWNFGERTFEIQNFWIPDTATASTISDNFFQEFSAIKYEIKFTTSFFPKVDILDLCQVSYDSSKENYDSLWDVKDWAYDNTNLSGDLYWDENQGDSIRLDGDEFRYLSIEIDLDKLENKFIGREA